MEESPSFPNFTSAVSTLYSLKISILNGGIGVMNSWITGTEQCAFNTVLQMLKESLQTADD